MRRGTTPTHTFSTDISLVGAEVLFVTYKQLTKTVLEKTVRDVTIKEDSVEVTLTQQETLRFKEGDVEMQIRARMPDESAWVSNIMHTTTEKLLKGGVI